MIRTVLTLTVGLALAACGGRAHLEDSAGQSYRQIFQAQVDAKPSKRLAPMSADDAKISMANHEATFSKGTPRGDPSGGASASSLGLITPMTTGLGDEAGGGDEYNYPGQRPIQLQAR